MILFTLIVLAVVSANSESQNFCQKRRQDEYTALHAVWDSEECTTKAQIRGTRCFLKCMDGFSLIEGATAFSDCLQIGSTSWSKINISRICAPTSYCTVPEGSQYNCESGEKVSIETSCSVKDCPVGKKREGPGTIKCEAHETWSAGGSFCEALSPNMDAKCPVPKIDVPTDPGNSTADVRRYLTYPKLTGLNPSQSVPINSSLDVGSHEIVFQYSGIDNGDFTCSVDVIVKDQEAPTPVRCVQEVESVIPTNTNIKLQIQNCTFKDNVDGEVKGKTTTTYTGRVDPGDYSLEFTASDTSGNEIKLPMTYTVKDKTCALEFPVDNVDIHHTFNGLYQPRCVNGTFSYDNVGLLDQIPFQGFINKMLPFSRCDESTFTLKGLYRNPAFVDCFNKFPIAANKSCPRGQVPSTNKTFCIPCPKSFYFDDTNEPRCKLCPVNQTTTKRGTVGSCVPCPANSMTTKERLAPIRCEYLCQAGEATTSSGCVKCGIGEFVGRGGATCISCQTSTTTIVQQPTSTADCVPGSVINSGKNGLVSPTGPDVNSYSIRFNLPSDDYPDNQLVQGFSVKVTSDYLSKQIDCSKDYVEIVGYLKGIATKLTKKLCGKELENLIITKYRPWRVNIVRFVFSQQQKPQDFSINYAVGDDLCQAGSIFNVTSQQCEPCKAGSYQELHNGFVCKQCTNGKTNYGEGQIYCVDPCPPGFSGDGISCLPCAMNSYGENATCTECPVGKATATDGSAECSTDCGLGNYLNGTQCSDCPYGMYQPLSRHAQNVCRYCPKGKTTLAMGSTDMSDCVDKCHYEGEYYDRALKSCKPCPVGAYKIASAVTVEKCVQCPADWSTLTTGSIFRSNCTRGQTPCEKKNPCKMPGQCVNNGNNTSCVCPKYYTGEFCDQVDGPCKTSPCGNGTCHPFSVADNGNNYVCICKPGFTGTNCESEHNVCDPNPCFSGNCTRVGKLDYNCTCSTYFSGKKCTNRAGPCDNPSNCVQGQCDDDPEKYSINNYTCLCVTGYRGKACDEKIDYCKEQPCDVNGTQKCEPKAFGRDCVCNQGYFGDTCNEYRKCNAGEFYYRKDCCKCWHGTYSTQNDADGICESCPTGQSTLNRGSISKLSCEDISNKERQLVEFHITDTAFQGDLITEGCGGFEERIEKQVGIMLSKRGIEDAAVEVKHYLAPPAGETGRLVQFIVYGPLKNVETALEDAVNTFDTGDLSVEKGSLKISERHKGEDGDDSDKDKDKNNTGLIVGIVLGIIVAIAVILVVVYMIKAKKCPMNSSNKKTTPDENDGMMTTTYNTYT